jgi:serine/threonine-protein kinase
MTKTNDDNQNPAFEEAIEQFVDSQLWEREPNIDEFVKRFPQYEHLIRKRIKKIQKIHALFDSLIQAEESDFEETAIGQNLMGEKISSFEITKVIGRGGMGIVYLAHDTKLNRSVALKSMPAQLKDDSTAQARFKREAELLASLNHPNIATIHDIIEVDKSGYLVLEYVPGETLAERIAREHLNLEEALSISLQIAEAISAAHENGIVHRDLKPGNIKITTDGKVKVLDFGLAKTSMGEAKNIENTVTQPGGLIGTPAYMSPEQACGKPTDKRSDIWSFGCVMYQMLTGELAFEGETATEILARIIECPPDLDKLPENTPMNIRVMIRRCLEKDPRRRLRDIGDAVIEITETLNSPTISLATVEKIQPFSMRRLTVVGLACLILVSLVTSLVTWSLTRPGQSLSNPVMRYVIRPETDLSREALWFQALALSPDGRRLAYVEEGSDARRIIYLRELDEFEAKPLPGTENAISPFFSPNGEWIGYVDHHERKLKKISINGGQPIVLCETTNFRGGTWGADDTIIFTPFRREGLWRISASGERLERLTVPDPNQGERGHLWPEILPGGKVVLFTNMCRGFVDAENQIELYGLETGKRHILLKGGTCARYVPTGHIVYAHKKTLYAARFDADQLKLTGPGVPVVPHVLEGQSQSAQFAVSRNGSLAYIPVVTRSTKLIPVWVDREGRIESLPMAARNYGVVAISPDGTRLAFDEGDQSDIWMYDLTRQTLTQLTSDGINYYPVWTQGGKWVVYQSFQIQTMKNQLLRQNVTDNGKPELLATFQDFHVWPTCCSPDGKELLVLKLDRKRPMFDLDISVIPFEKQSGKSHLRPFIQRNNNQRVGKWSPDGRWVAYDSDESGRWEIYMEPYPGPGQKVMISRQGGYSPRWSRDGKELFYRGGYDSPKMIAATIETEPEIKVIEYKELFEKNFRFYDVAPDGRFLLIQDPGEPTILGINIVLNWFEELKHLVPTGKEE